MNAAMTDILLLGLSHKTAPIELRECIAFSTDETADALERLQKNPDVSETMLFSTCNRVEILFVTKNETSAVEAVKKFIAEFKQVPVTTFEESFYIHAGDEAVRHVFRVASSLDSMMVGEPQILGQIKEAYQTAALKQTPGVILNRLLPRAFSVAKRVRTETGIGDHAVSISYAAIELGRKIFDTLEQKKVLLIGAGEMAEIAVEHLLRNKVGGIFVAPLEIENCLLTHPSVRECAVIGNPDEEGLIKPMAFVVLKRGVDPSENLAKEIQGYVKSTLAPYKYPRWVRFIDELPKDDRGKTRKRLLK